MNDRLTRWCDDELPLELRRVLSAADEDAVDASQIMRLESKLRVALGAEFGATGAGAARALEAMPSARAVEPPDQPSLAASSSAIPSSLALGALALLGVGALVFGLTTHRREPPSAPRIEAGARPPTSLAPPPARPPRIAAPAFVPAQPAASVPAQPAASVPAQPAASVPAQPAASVIEGAAPQPRAARAVTTPRDATMSAANGGGGGLTEELRQLEVVRRLLANSPERALLAADRHARRFAGGALGPERELLRLEALLRMQRFELAEQLASRLMAAPEGHPYAAQVTQLMRAHAPRAN
jgi:hypothetical protein